MLITNASPNTTYPMHRSHVKGLLHGHPDTEAEEILAHERDDYADRDSHDRRHEASDGRDHNRICNCVGRGGKFARSLVPAGQQHPGERDKAHYGYRCRVLPPHHSGEEERSTGAISMASADEMRITRHLPNSCP